MRRVVPAYGPHRDRLCVQHEDGTLEPCPVVDTAHLPPAVVLPEEFGPTLAYDRETVERTVANMVHAGHSPERAKEIAVTAALRNRHGQMGRPYTTRS